ncbi:MAG: response regulator [Rhodocyclaceae bacterium]|nr:response regulator [Rhodocyclaceae bacterium]
MSDNTTSYKVLVVDDTATNRQILDVFLKRLGYQTIQACDGAQALEKFDAEQPDLVLMDVMMPVMDGFEATRHIKEREANRWVPVVFISAMDKDENLVAGLEAGGDDYLFKPVNFVVLKAKLKSIVRTLELHRQVEETTRQLQTITDSLVDGLITINRQATILSVNPAVENIFGYETGELLGRNVNVLMPEPYHSEHDRYVRDYVMGGMPKILGIGQHELKGRRKNGDIFDLDLAISETRIGGERIFIGTVRDTSERMADRARERAYLNQLRQYQERQEAENALAYEILMRQINRPGFDDPAVHHWLSPVAEVSGDVVAAVRSPNGELVVMLADATGHGLAASISTSPVLTLFYEMAEWGLVLSAIVSRINDQLCSALPASRFVAAAFVSIDERNGTAQVWVGGPPPILLLGPDGQVCQRFESDRLPLGITEIENDQLHVTEVAWVPGSQFVLFSDGLQEACDAAGAAFGNERIEQALAAAPAEKRIEGVRNALRAFTGGSVPHDDVSLLLVDCRARE